MKFGTETGSLINHLFSGSAFHKPEIGEGATLLSWTDRYPATVIDYDEKKKIVTVQDDKYVRIDKNGLSESQTYEYAANTDGCTRTFKHNGDKWYPVVFNKESKRWNKVNACGVLIGRREKYNDPTF